MLPKISIFSLEKDYYVLPKILLGFLYTNFQNFIFKTTLKYTRTKYAEFSHTFKRDAKLELRTDNICIPSTAAVSRVGERDS